MKTKEYTFYFVYNGHTGLVRTHEDGDAEILNEKTGVWTPSRSMNIRLTGAGGDSDFDEVSEEDAKRRFPKGFSE